MDDLLSYNETGLASALSALTVPAMTAFAGSCACRIVTTAAARGAEVGLALNAIDCLRTFASGGTIENGDRIEAQLVASIPHEDEAPEFTASMIEDALAAAAYGLRCAAKGDAMDAVWAARRAYETADRYVGLRINATAFTADGEAAIVSHPLVQSELRRQRRDVDDLRRMSGDPTQLVTLIDRARLESLLD